MILCFMGEFFEDFLSMPCRFYISPFSLYLSSRVEEKCRTDDADIGFSIVFLLTDDAELLMELTTLIGYELDTE